MSKRIIVRIALLLVVAAAIAIVVFVMRSRGEEAVPVAASRAPTHAPPPAPTKSENIVAPEPALANVSPAAKIADAPPRSKPEALQGEALVAHKRRAVELIDAALVRTEAERVEAERAGDDNRARAARIRVEQLREVRDKRIKELGDAQ